MTNTTLTTPRLRWTKNDRGDLTAGAFAIVPARVGMTWELWRYQAGLGSEALGMGSQEELMTVAARLSGWTIEAGHGKPQEDFSALIASLTPKPKRKTGMARAWEWLNS